VAGQTDRPGRYATRRSSRCRSGLSEAVHNVVVMNDFPHKPELPPQVPVVIDCDSCVVRSAAACGDCVVTVLLGSPPEGITLDDSEVAAIDVLAREGLVPPLRLVTPLSSREPHAS